LLPGEIASLLDASDYVGDAAERALVVAEMLREAAWGFGT
jgi:hypothetical protein